MVVLVGLVVVIVFSIAMAIVSAKRQKRPPVAPVPVAERHAQLLKQAAGGSFKQLLIRIKGDRVESVWGRDLGPLPGARAELSRGKPAPQHGIAYQVVIGSSLVRASPRS